MLKILPRYISDKAMMIYAALLLIIPVIFGHPMTWYWWVFGIVEVAGFFYLGNRLTNEWQRDSSKRFIGSVFWVGLLLRIAYVVFSNYFYMNQNHSFFEFGAADSYAYHMLAERGADMISRGEFNFLKQFQETGLIKRLDQTDIGYPVYLSFIYFLTSKSYVAARLVKALLSSLSIILAYRIAKRNFGETTARLTAIFCMLMPNLIYYCGTHVKETEMLFITMLFLDRADLLIRRNKANWLRILECAVLCVACYYFRVVLAVVLALALLAGLVFTRQKISSGMKGTFIAILIILMIGTVFWNTVSEALMLSDYTNVQAQQEQNMQWRSERAGGNTFAKYASATVFAPLIFTIPFPTMANIPGQENLQLLHGGIFIKNITSFFTILALFFLLKTGKWREKVLPIAFTCGYLIVLVFSSFAQSERFHIPILPMSLMLAAYGLSTVFAGKHKRWFLIWIAFIFVANLAWTWLKLRGRGM